MFTGLIEAVGTVRRVTPRGAGADLEIAAPLAAELVPGESVAVSGVCLTAAEVAAGTFTANAVEETLRVTTLGRLGPGDRVNLERALKVGGRLGGHLVAGHVDGVGVVKARSARPYGETVEVEVPEDLVRYLAPKGSVAVDGASLTLGEVRGRRAVLHLIPHTVGATVAGGYAPGAFVNVEVDLISRYLETLLASATRGPQKEAQ